MADTTTTALADTLNTYLDEQVDFGLLFLPGTFDQGKRWFTNTQAGRPSALAAVSGTIETVAGVGQVLTVAGDGQGVAPSIYQRGYMPLTPGNAYRSRLRIRQTVDNANIGSRVYHGISCYAADWSYLGDIVFAAEDTDLTVAEGWQTYTQSTDTTTVLATYATATYIKSRCRPNCDAAGDEGDGTVQLKLLELRDLGAPSSLVSDEAYNATTWNGVTTVAPSKNAVRDWIESLLGGVSSSFDTLVEIAASLATKAGLASANTFTAAQVIQVSSGAPLQLRLDDNGAAIGPILQLYRNSASPVASDIIGALDLIGNTTTGLTTYLRAVGTILDPTNASEDAVFALHSRVAGTLAARVNVGAGLYHDNATGGDKGDNTLNFGTIYQNNVQVATLSGSETLTNKTLTSPIIATGESYANAAAATTTRDNLAQKFKAHKNGTDQTSLSTGVAVKITAATEAFDVGSAYDTTNSRWTPAAGMVRLKASAQLFGANLNRATLFIYKNGAERCRTVKAFDFNAFSLNWVHIQVDVTDSANGTDYYEAYLMPSISSGTADIEGDSNYTWFEGHQI